MTRNLSFPVAALLALLAAAPADAANRFTIRGAGFGHGVGMSQYGAMGYASHGWTYDRILAHYYTGTALSELNAPRDVRVLVASPGGTASFSGATRGAGRSLSASRTYRVRARAGGQLELLSAGGRSLATVGAPLRVTSASPLRVPGVGSYRDALEFRPGTFGGVNVINAVDVDDYVKGVVPLESPASWPIEALKAQAVAARTYALTTSKGGTGWEHYTDTRSQVYGGVGAEQPSTNEAVEATAGQLVTYQGEPVATYFFSTSGGRTENVENTSLGDTPLPWLKSVKDRYDSVSPRHRWGPIRMSRATAGARLSGLVKGSFRGIKVVERGRSPRIVAADIVGTGGRTRIDGATIRARLGLYDTWARFTSIRTGSAPPPDEPAGPPTPPPTPAPEGNPETGGITPGAVKAGVRAVAGLSGSVLPAKAGATVTVQRREAGRWVRIGTARVGKGGRYHAGVSATGAYRVRYRGDAGPAVRIG
jgi:stage II sporulation protein D